MSIPTAEELQALLSDLTTAVENYSTEADLSGYKSRVDVISRAKKISQALTVPENLPN